MSEQETKSAETLLGEPEPWESWETQLVGWSIGIAIIGLIILGWLINTFILH
uniref:Uncharacterized protein n=1 Tax=Candidatus Kentrum sp. LFY TaxID=2126342 RepID=A0A450UPI8_9GAMM|nr:MAG: hypothetical protein BECKLFY1418B_GA0070995_105815 [Candidatus Kentron sp. LFY]